MLTWRALKLLVWPLEFSNPCVCLSFKRNVAYTLRRRRRRRVGTRACKRNSCALQPAGSRLKRGSCIVRFNRVPLESAPSREAEKLKLIGLQRDKQSHRGVSARARAPFFFPPFVDLLYFALVEALVTSSRRKRVAGALPPSLTRANSKLNEEIDRSEREHYRARAETIIQYNAK